MEVRSLRIFFANEMREIKINEDTRIAIGEGMKVTQWIKKATDKLKETINKINKFKYERI